MIRTGTKPGVRAWAYWIFNDIQYGEEWYELARELAIVTGADVTATNPSRIARAAGLYTLPPAKKRERGYANELARIKGRGDLWDAATLRDQLTAFISAQPRQIADRAANPLDRKVSKWSGMVEPLDLEALKENCRNGILWNESAFRLVGHYCRQGLADDDVVALMLPLTSSGYTQQDTEREIRDMIRRTRERQGIQPKDVDGGPSAANPTAPANAPALGMTGLKEPLSVKRPGEMSWKGQLPMAVQGVMPLHGTTMLAADANVGKSMLTIGMCYAVSAGQPFLGRATTKAFCLYVGLEGRAELVPATLRIGTSRRPFLI